MELVSIFPDLLGADGALLNGMDGARLLSLTAVQVSVADFDLTTVLPLGFVRTRAFDDGLMSAWAANDYQPLSTDQVIAVTGTPPAPLTSLPDLWRGRADEWGWP